MEQFMKLIPRKEAFPDQRRSHLRPVVKPSVHAQVKAGIIDPWKYLCRPVAPLDIPIVREGARRKNKSQARLTLSNKSFT